MAPKLSKAGAGLDTFLRAAAPRARGSAGTEYAVQPLSEDEVAIVVVKGSRAILRTVRVPRRSKAVDDMALRLAGLETLVQQVADEGEEGFTAEERQALVAGGFELDAPSPDDPNVLASLELAHLLDSTLSVEQAASRLGVNESRVRQRLLASPPTLYGVKASGAWRLPSFQFVGKHVLPGLDALLASLDPALSPAAFVRWLRAPNPDLAVGKEETATSPLRWLRAGRSAEPVAQLARDL